VRSCAQDLVGFDLSLKHAEKELNAAKVILGLFEEKALAEETFAK
jgi:hypothetical protein